MKHLIKLSINHPYWIIVIVMLITYLAFQSASKIQLNNSIDIWFSEDSKTKQDYLNFIETFDERGFISIMYFSNAIFSENEIAFNQKLIKRFQRVENIKYVQGYSNTQVIDTNKKSNSEFTSGFIAKDNSLTLIRLAVLKNNAVLNYRTMNRIYEVLNEAEFKTRKLYVTGTIAIYEQLNRLLGKESAKFFVISLFLILILFIVFYRSIKHALIGFSVIIISIILLLGGYAFLNLTANNVTNLLLVLVLLAVVLNHCNVVTKYKRLRQENIPVPEALSIALNALYLSSVVSSVLSAAVFLILTMSSIEPISNFGFFAILAILIPLVLCFSLVPAIIVIFDGRAKSSINRQKKNTLGFFGGLFLFNKISYKYLMMAYIVVSIIGLVMSNLEKNQLSGLKQSNLITESIFIAHSKFSGIFPLQLIINNNNSAITEKELLVKINRLQRLLEDNDSVASTKSIIDSNKNFQDKYLLSNLSQFRIIIYGRWLENKKLNLKLDEFYTLSTSVFDESFYSITFSGDIYIRFMQNYELWAEQLLLLCLSLVIVFLISLMFFKKINTAITFVLVSSLSILLAIFGITLIGLNIEIATALLVTVILVFIFNFSIQLHYSKNDSIALSDFYESSKISTLIIVLTMTSLLLSKYLLLVYFSIFFILSILTITILLHPLLIKSNIK